MSILSVSGSQKAPTPSYLKAAKKGAEVQTKIKRAALVPLKTLPVLPYLGQSIGIPPATQEICLHTAIKKCAFRQYGNDLKARRQRKTILVIDQEIPFKETAEQNITAYESGLELLGSYYKNMFFIYRLYSKFSQCDTNAKEFLSAWNLQKIKFQLTESLVKLSSFSFKDAFENSIKNFEQQHMNLKNINSATKNHHEFLSSKEEYFREERGMPVHNKWAKLKGRIFNCHIKHNDILENYEKLIKQRIRPEMLDSLLTLSKEDLPFGEKC